VRICSGRIGAGRQARPSKCTLTGRIAPRRGHGFTACGTWAAGLVSAVLSLSGGGVDGHVKAEGLELAEVVADLAVAAGLLVVPAGSEVSAPGRWVGEEVPAARLLT
jgi:hypothetical protein